MGAMLFQKRRAQGCEGDQYPFAVLIVTLDETAFIGFLPDRKVGTRGTPDLHDLGISPRTRTDPFEEVQDQGFDGVGHSHLLHDLLESEPTTTSGKLDAAGPGVLSQPPLLSQFNFTK
jgi:hypothetical protein